MTIIVDIRRREIKKLWCESSYYVTRRANDVNICIRWVVSLLTKNLYRTEFNNLYRTEFKKQ